MEQHEMDSSGRTGPVYDGADIMGRGIVAGGTFLELEVQSVPMSDTQTPAGDN